MSRKCNSILHNVDDEIKVDFALVTEKALQVAISKINHLQRKTHNGVVTAILISNFNTCIAKNGSVAKLSCLLKLC